MTTRVDNVDMSEDKKETVQEVLDRLEKKFNESIPTNKNK